ncbi:hypothetical protein INS49_010370 [Diaporthe citri]|uniref:uncharacterized protein n=1 Tax=Diaporthe citri TaxID=83186 RepID=UPI001C82020C|nr:uncharacterized protein INS49_010370 [Diaporthe citri]KAG6362141.1 hypothetical protein INS49_010370 [Diaporthe citri]
MAITRGKGTADVLPSVAGHRAVKPSYVDKLELLGPLCQDPSPALGEDGVNETDPTGCVASAELVSKVRAAVSDDALAPDGSAARTIRANCPALPRDSGGPLGFAAVHDMRALVGLSGRYA